MNATVSTPGGSCLTSNNESGTDKDVNLGCNLLFISDAEGRQHLCAGSEKLTHRWASMLAPTMGRKSAHICAECRGE